MVDGASWCMGLVVARCAVVMVVGGGGCWRFAPWCRVLVWGLVGRGCRRVCLGVSVAWANVALCAKVLCVSEHCFVFLKLVLFD